MQSAVPIQVEAVVLRRRGGQEEEGKEAGAEEEIFIIGFLV